MTKKDYVAIAGAIKTARTKQVTTGRTQHTIFATWAVDDTAIAIADVLRADNSKFDTTRFLQACGL